MPVSCANAAARPASRLATATTDTFVDGCTAATNRRAMRAAPSTPMRNGEEGGAVIADAIGGNACCSAGDDGRVDHARHLRDAILDVRDERRLRAAPVAREC